MFLALLKSLGLANPWVALAATVVERFVLPEVVDLIKRKQDEKNGVFPTAAEVQEAWRKELTGGIATGNDWLASHPG